MESPERETVVALCPVATCVIGGLVVPKNTSYVTGSPSGSLHVQLRIGDVVWFVAPLDGEGFDGTAGGLLGAEPVVKLQTGLSLKFLLLSFARIFQ